MVLLLMIFEVYDRDNNVSLVTSTFSNMNKKSEEMSTGIISSPPLSETVLEFNVKRTGGNGKKYIRIEEISLLFAVKI